MGEVIWRKHKGFNYVHSSPLNGVNWLHEILLIFNPLVNESNFCICFVFIVGPIISPILFEKLQNAMKNSEHCVDCTTTRPELPAKLTELVNRRLNRER
jgi:hypothetical protein